MKMHKVSYSESGIPPPSYACTCCQEGVAFGGNKQGSWGDGDGLLFFAWIVISKACDEIHCQMTCSNSPYKIILMSNTNKSLDF